MYGDYWSLRSVHAYWVHADSAAVPCCEYGLVSVFTVEVLDTKAALAVCSLKLDIHHQLILPHYVFHVR